MLGEEHPEIAERGFRMLMSTMEVGEEMEPGEEIRQLDNYDSGSCNPETVKLASEVFHVGIVLVFLCEINRPSGSIQERIDRTKNDAYEVLVDGNGN
ncbi:unnamed protein product [Thelazia callipaeda]|uniref:Protein kinase domain-containing protein n=1 Tax=Thelazia callipaeda TaxID=103827 RepID=A0A0N5CWN4_THECL|nr:unnamed protein product [Thelazia callipaeda]